jgi:hypothetical protein
VSDDGIIHGTISAYRRKGGCRCEKCRAVHAEYTRRNRAERLAQQRLNHGTRSAYDAGCRCYPCVDARRRAYDSNPGEYPAKWKKNVA